MMPFTEDDPCLPVWAWNAGLAIVPGGTLNSDVSLVMVSKPARRTGETWRRDNPPQLTKRQENTNNPSPAAQKESV